MFGVGRGWVKSDAKRQRSTKIDTQRQVTVKEFIVNGSKKNLVEGEEVVAMPVHAPNAKQPARKPTPHIDRLWIGGFMRKILNFFKFRPNNEFYTFQNSRHIFDVHLLTPYFLQE